MTQIKIVRGSLINIERLVNLALKELQEKGCIIINMELYYVDDRDSEHIVWITYNKPTEEEDLYEKYKDMFVVEEVDDNGEN